MKNKKVIFAFIGIIIILIAVIGGIIIFNNINNKKELPKKEVTNQEQLSNQVNSSEQKLVYDAKYINNLTQTSYINGFNQKYSVEDLKVPYINLDSEDAKKVKNEIKNLYQKFLEIFQENLDDIANGKMSNDCKSNYNSYINGNTLSVVIDIQYGERLYKNYYTYNFDLVTLKLLSYEEVYKRAGFTDENITSRVENAIRNCDIYKEYNQDDAQKCIQKTIKAYNEKSLKDIGRRGIDSEYYLGYYLNKEGKLDIIIYFDILADIGYRIDPITII